MFAVTFLKIFENVGLWDTCDLESEFSENGLRKFLTAYPKILPHELPPAMFQIQTTTGNFVLVRKQATLPPEVAKNELEKNFNVLPKIGTIWIGIIFINKYFVTLDISKQLVQFPYCNSDIRTENDRANFVNYKLLRDRYYPRSYK